MKFRSLFLLVYILILGTLIASSVSAENRDTFAFWPTYGLNDSIIGSNPYYEDPSVSQYGYTWHNQQARNAWDAAGYADIDFYRVSSYDAASTRIFAGHYTWATYWGKKQAYKSNGDKITDDELYNTVQTWEKVHILLNDYTMDNSNLTGGMRLKVTTHEYGHMLGMRHQPDGTDSIMDDGRKSFSSPRQLDYDNVNWKY